MKIKTILPLLIFALILGGCSKKADTAKQTPSNVKILVNELPFKDRPFTVLVPHESNRVFTFYTQNANKAKAGTLDLEYQSGDLLKGARATLDTPIPNPFVKAIILGSCSTGGKCTFDTNLKSGTMKFRLDFEGETVVHVLKGDFTFVLGQNNLPDGKVIFAPSKANAKDNLILVNSLGLPTPVEKEIALYPIVISSVGNKAISGNLTINQSGVTEMAIFDGTGFKPLKFTAKENTLTVALNEKPWQKQVTIIRDDQKGSQENLNLYLIGPIILYK